MNSIRKSQTIKFKGFGGIDARTVHTDPTGTSDLINFRIGEDGSLKKREGSRFLCDIDDIVRDVWTGKLGGRFRCLVVATDNILEIGLESGTVTTVAPTHDTELPAKFFYYRGSLYLVDGKGLWRVDDGALTSPFGYVPHVIKDWSDNYVGEIYQPRNLLNNKGRLTYVVSPNATSVLRLDDFILSVDALYVNGKLLSSDKYSVGTASPYINVIGLAAGDRVEVFVTYPDSPEGLAALSTVTRAVVFGGINTSRPLLFGGEDGAVMFSSVYVTEDDLKASQRAHSQSDSLYFPVGCEFTVGDGRYPITAVSRHYDRLLVFTEGGAWMAGADVSGKDTHPVMNVNSSVGVISPMGAALLGNSPCTIGHGSIYRWTSETDELNDCNAYSISEQVDSLIDERFYRSASVFADKRRRELIFHCPQITNRVWVYSEITKKWTTFTGLSPDFFFETENGLGYISGSMFFITDDALSTDYGLNITATFTGNVIDFDTAEKKHMSSLELCFDGKSAVCGLRLDGESSPTAEVRLEGEGHTRLQQRVSARRFCYVVPTITVNGSESEVVHSMSIKVR